jgi:hypothetical protein
VIDMEKIAVKFADSLGAAPPADSDGGVSRSA